MADLGGFDANIVPPQLPFEVLPAGHYLAVIVASAMEPSKAGGRFLKLEWEIVDGPAKGRRLFSRLNLENANPKAVSIARAELSAICHAVGVLTPRDSAQLHALPLVLDVRCKARKDNGELANEIRGYVKKNDAARAAAALAAETATDKPSWMR